MRNTILIIVIALLALSCVRNDVTNKFALTEPANMVRLSADTTELILKDYFPLIDHIDSVSSLTLSIERRSTFDTILIVKTDKSKVINTLNVYSANDKGVLAAFNNSNIGHNANQKELSIITTKCKEKSLSLLIKGDNPEFLILWQNTVIDPFNVSISNKVKGEDGYLELKIEIPHYASFVERSYLRIVSFNTSSISNDVFVPLNFGKVISSVNELKRTDKHNQIIYSLLIDRFYDGDLSNTKKLNDSRVLSKVDYYGGDLQGIVKKIDDGFFRDLGINTIWLSPITQNPYDAWGQYPDPKTKFSGYHGYWPIYVTKIDDRFGDSTVLKNLIDQAHNGNINVILDYVANHMHINSPTLRNNPDWVTPNVTPDGRPNFELWDEFRLTTWFDKHIPSLDLEKEYVYRPMSDSALFWLDNFDFDGFRHDATKHIPEVFWRTLTNKIKSKYAQRSVFQIGETYGSPELIGSYIRNGMLDGQFDFNVYDSMIWTLINRDGSFINVWKTLENSMKSYGYHNLMGYITGNHDRPRFISLAGGALKPDEDFKLAGWKREIGVGDVSAYDKLSILHSFIMTIPGIPTIYYGDEYGEPGANDPDNRRWMRFENYSEKEQDVLDRIKKLILYRKQSLPLIYGDTFPLYVSNNIIAYARIYLGEVVIVAINKSDITELVEVSLPFELTEDNINTWFGKMVSIEGKKLVLEVSPLSYTIISNHK